MGYAIVKFQRILAALMIVVFCFPSGPLVGQIVPPMGSQIGVGVKVETISGVNQQTLEVLEQFAPKEFHDQAIATIRDAMPLLQQNVDEFLKKATYNVETLVSDGQCAAYGTSAEWKRQWSHFLSKKNEGPIAILDDDIAETMRDVKTSFTPEKYSHMYGDLHFKSEVLWCEMNLGEAVDAKKLTRRYEELNLLWSRLEDEGCIDASDCVKKVRAGTESLIFSSNRLDVQFVRATEKLKKVPQPVGPTIPQRLAAFGHFDPAPYETALRQLLQIRDGLALAKSAREQLAKEPLADAQHKIQYANAEVGIGIQSLQPRHAPYPCHNEVSLAQVQDANSHADHVNSECSTMDGALSVPRALQTEKAIGAGASTTSCRAVDTELALAYAFDSASQRQSVDDLKNSLKGVTDRVQVIRSASVKAPYMIPGCTGITP
jgi:hypothetical protein